MIILRNGQEWHGCSADAVSNFHEIARNQGSVALWLCEAGFLVVPKASGENQTSYPYDEWRQLASDKANADQSTLVSRPVF